MMRLIGTFFMAASFLSRGALGGAFFLSPVYSDLPQFASDVQKLNPDNDEVLYLDIASSTDISQLKSDLSKIEGYQSFEELGVTIPLWRFSDQEYEYLNGVIGNIDPHFSNYTVNQTSGEIYIALPENYTSSQALEVFADWYKLVYAETISYAQIHAKLVVSSSSLDDVEDLLLEKGIVASSIEGPSQSTLDNTNASMLSNTEFTIACGGLGVVVGLIGIYFNTVAVGFRRFNRFLHTKRKR